ncbi:NUDIX hydrolase [bacterium]|nr:NUDIX hydrolase [bacterium]
MTYTEQQHVSKSLGSLPRRLRMWVVRLWLKTFGPRWTVGVLCILRDSEGRVCLLKHKGRVKPWGLPGGLIKWPELPQVGLVREIYEELGWSATEVLGQTPFVLRNSLVSENFPMLELIFEANRTLSADECAGWAVQASEISEFAWFHADELAALQGILERHRALLLDVLRRT